MCRARSGNVSFIKTLFVNDCMTCPVIAQIVCSPLRPSLCFIKRKKKSKRNKDLEHYNNAKVVRKKELVESQDKGEYKIT